MNRQSKSPEYKVLYMMIQRCHNKKNQHYNDYGGRGIAVCERWRERKDGLNNFIADVGRRPSDKYELHRTDGSKGYEPGNCSWVIHEVHACMPKAPYRFSDKKRAASRKSMSFYPAEGVMDKLRALAKRRERALNWLINRAVMKFIENEEAEEQMKGGK